VNIFFSTTNNPEVYWQFNLNSNPFSFPYESKDAIQSQISFKFIISFLQSYR